ncbi:unnamed protein product [Phytomonas sp. Hart1]|nr:unnamed protein product [Phytomonas sp. Hart1]|eukprot:CCW69332.1 unnamed protein product [Phytomonas sp. isolate Hart1]
MELLRLSVHAATTASTQREEGKRQWLEEGKTGERKRPRDGEGAAEDGKGTSDAATKARVSSSAPPFVPILGVDDDSGRDPALALSLSRRLMEVLRSFQREQQSSIRLRDLRERLGGLDPIREIQQTLTNLQGDAFVYEMANGDDDLIQFM